MSLSKLPVTIIVPGAFGTPQGFEKLLPYLTKAGYATYPGSYPSCNSSDPAKASAPQDIAFLRDTVLLPHLYEHGKDVVIIAHSYGGVVAGGATKGLAKENRRAQGGAYPPFIKVDKPSQGLAAIGPAMEVLYNDCDSAPEPELDKLLQPHALRAFETPATAPAWAESAFDGRRAYVRTLDDCLNPSSLQDLWLEKSKVEWEPQALAEQIIKFTDGFIAK
ncbi:esterase/lipase family protein [Aspergillus homomorphus CBS 101889]|uniref:AB hydrolase-1 domain-containing protein n=1 Tax=Aspergillus homomorphus (strain CBS 101889) TaxID=1450537 RepID=A0A395I8L5_ASPHC|nr:hypothetical protein BO97DRAFT_431446 [Aspergillus homomorphus CBS 101889]RAL16592.1 hypothetical protein BO97DRAFT_431446 [Aspergillus homomorphus CBS 101889]